MFTIAMALISGGVIAASSNTVFFLAITALLPIYIVIMRHFVILVLDRYYARFLEAVVVQKKNRHCLKIGEMDRPPFHDDRFLITNRQAEVEEIGPSTMWVRTLMDGGHNKVVASFTMWLFGFSLTISAGAALRIVFDDSVSFDGGTESRMIVGGRYLLCRL